MRWFLFFLFVFSPVVSVAETIFVAPGIDDGTVQADGTRELPYRSLQSALGDPKLEKGGEITLFDGYYGDIFIGDVNTSEVVRIRPEEPSSVLLTGLTISASSNLAFTGFQIWPVEFPVAREALIEIDERSSDITLESLDLRGGEGASNYADWPLETWLLQAVGGLRSNGADVRLVNSTLTALSTPISVGGPDTVLEGNLVDGFGLNAITGLQARSRVVGNTIVNCVRTQNSSAGIAVLARASRSNDSVLGITIEGNTILETADPTRAQSCELFGVMALNGGLADLAIRNNLIVVSSWHGISVAGVRDAVISNNTVANSSEQTGRPWIGVFDHKLLGNPETTVVANNIAPKFETKQVYKGLQMLSNLETKYPFRTFADPNGLDFAPKPGSPAATAADAQFVPDTDLYGTKRPLGSGPSLGAIEAE